MMIVGNGSKSFFSNSCSDFKLMIQIYFNLLYDVKDHHTQWFAWWLTRKHCLHAGKQPSKTELMEGGIIQYLKDRLLCWSLWSLSDAVSEVWASPFLLLSNAISIMIAKFTIISWEPVMRQVQIGCASSSWTYPCAGRFCAGNVFWLVDMLKLVKRYRVYMWKRRYFVHYSQINTVVFFSSTLFAVSLTPIIFSIPHPQLFSTTPPLFSTYPILTQLECVH